MKTVCAAASALFIITQSSQYIILNRRNINHHNENYDFSLAGKTKAPVHSAPPF
jgi:hypothetical protein